MSNEHAHMRAINTGITLCVLIAILAFALSDGQVWLAVVVIAVLTVATGIAGYEYRKKKGKLGE